MSAKTNGKYKVTAAKRQENRLRKRYASGILIMILLAVFLMACAPAVNPEVEPAVTVPQSAQEAAAITEDQLAQGDAATPEPVATSTAKPFSQSPERVKPPEVFLKGMYGLIIFTKEDSPNQQQLAELTADNLEAVLTATGALKDVGLIVDQLPEESGGDWATASLGARIGFWIDAVEDNGLLTVQSSAFFPDDELLLGEGSLGLNRTADAILEPFATGTLLEASDILADRLAVIVNAYIGYSAIQEGNYTECARRFNSALDFIDQVEVSYNRADASHNALGLCLAALDRADEAKIHYEAAIILNPDSSGAHYGLGNYYFQQGNYEMSREYFDLTVEKTLVDSMATEEVEARAYAGLGNVALISGDYENAISYFEMAISISPDYPAYYLTRALAKGVAGRDDYTSDLQMCVTLVDKEREPSDYFQQVAADCQQYLDAGFDFVEVVADGSEPAIIAESNSDEGFRVDIVYSSISVRNGPGVGGYKVVGYLYADEEVMVIARTANGIWYLVELETGQMGWVNAMLLQRASGDSFDVPLAATIPPTPILTMTPVPTATSLLTIVVTLPPNNKPKKKKTPEPAIVVPTIPAPRLLLPGPATATP